MPTEVDGSQGQVHMLGLVPRRTQWVVQDKPNLVRNGGGGGGYIYLYIFFLFLGNNIFTRINEIDLCWFFFFISVFNRLLESFGFSYEVLKSTGIPSRCMIRIVRKEFCKQFLNFTKLVYYSFS